MDNAIRHLQDSVFHLNAVRDALSSVRSREYSLLQESNLLRGVEDLISKSQGLVTAQSELVLFLRGLSRAIEEARDE